MTTPEGLKRPLTVWATGLAVSDALPGLATRHAFSLCSRFCPMLAPAMEVPMTKAELLRTFYQEIWVNGDLEAIDR